MTKLQHSGKKWDELVDKMYVAHLIEKLTEEITTNRGQIYLGELMATLKKLIK